MVKSCLIVFGLIACLALKPATILAVTAEETLQSLGIEVAVDPSQSSASALIQLPSVYAIPGSFTYWFKSIIEQIQYILASTPESRTQLLLDFSQQRLAEGYQAIQDNNPQAAVDALTKYQQQQQELSDYLNTLQLDNVDMQPYLDKLEQQIGIQKALEDFVEQKVTDADIRSRVTSLLQVQPTQVVAFQKQADRVILGEHKIRPTPTPQSTQSATPSARPVN